MPTLFLAAAVEASPSPESLKSFLEVVLYLCGILLTGAAVWRLARGSSAKVEVAHQPLHVAAHDGSTPQSAHDRLEKKVEADSAKHTAARKGIYEKLDAHNGRLAALEGSRAATEKALGSLDDKIDENTKLTAEMKGQLGQINQSMHALTTSVTTFIQAQANAKK